MSTLSGAKALGSIEQGLRQAMDDLKVTDGRLSKVLAARAELQREEGAAYRELAGLRLDTLSRDAVVQEIETSERRALTLLEDHKATLAAIDEELAGMAGSGESLLQERTELVARMETLAERIDEAEAKTQSRLAKDPAFATQLETAKAAEAVLKRAERKADQAQADRVEKGKPYEESPLFIYLWNRGYGTSRYRAFPLIRWLDDKVAKLCGYAAARPNYAMLVELPEKLGEHADQVRALAIREAELLEELERDAMTADGVTDQANAYTDQEAKLEELDAKQANDNTELAELQRRRSQLMNGEGESFKKALNVLSSAYRQDSIRALYRDARSTSMPDDDLIVERLEDIASRKRELERDAAELKSLRKSQDKRISELSAIANKFRNQRFNSGNSMFSDPNLIAMVLGQFMQGVLSSSGLWDALRRQQRFDRRRADPGFGSGGLRHRGRRSRGGGLGPIGGGFGGGRSSGGFRTGGSF